MCCTPEGSKTSMRTWIHTEVEETFPSGAAKIKLCTPVLYTWVRANSSSLRQCQFRTPLWSTTGTTLSTADPVQNITWKCIGHSITHLSVLAVRLSQLLAAGSWPKCCTIMWIVMVGLATQDALTTRALSGWCFEFLVSLFAILVTQTNVKYVHVCDSYLCYAFLSSSGCGYQNQKVPYVLLLCVCMCVCFQMGLYFECSVCILCVYVCLFMNINKWVYFNASLQQFACGDNKNVVGY